MAPAQSRLLPDNTGSNHVLFDASVFAIVHDGCAFKILGDGDKVKAIAAGGNHPLKVMLQDANKTYCSKQKRGETHCNKKPVNPMAHSEIMVGIKITPFKKFKPEPVTFQVDKITDKDFQFGAYNNFDFEGKLAVLEVENHILRCALARTRFSSLIVGLKALIAAGSQAAMSQAIICNCRVLYPAADTDFFVVAEFPGFFGVVFSYYDHLIRIGIQFNVFNKTSDYYGASMVGAVFEFVFLTQVAHQFSSFGTQPLPPVNRFSIPLIFLCVKLVMIF